MTSEPDVAEALREAILRGDYVAGQRLVEVLRNRGARVRTVTIEEAIEITEVRRALEGLCAARAASRASRADKTRLKRIVTDMKAAWKAGELLRYSELNGELHGAIRSIADHQTAA